MVHIHSYAPKREQLEASKKKTGGVFAPPRSLFLIAYLVESRSVEAGRHPAYFPRDQVSS